MKGLRALSPALVSSLIALFVALGGTHAYASGLIWGQNSPHATAANLLRTCKRAIGFPIVALTPNTPALRRANRRIQAAYRKCTAKGRLAHLSSAHPKDQALRDAYHAHLDLMFGILEYRTYGGNVVRTDLGQDVLRNAQAHIARGRREAKHALAEL